MDNGSSWNHPPPRRNNAACGSDSARQSGVPDLGLPCFLDIKCRGGQRSQVHPEITNPPHTEILHPAHLSAALNFLRGSPGDCAPYFCDSSYRRYDGAACREELKRYLLQCVEPQHPLELSQELYYTSRSAARRASPGAVGHSGNFAEAISAVAPCATLAGEMYWLNWGLPESPWEVLRDLSLDIGVPSRSHRSGLFDPDFTHFGASTNLLPDGSCVVYIHFARFENLRYQLRSPLVGMEKRHLAPVCPINLASSEEEEEIVFKGEVASPAYRQGAGEPSRERRKRANADSCAETEGEGLRESPALQTPELQRRRISSPIEPPNPREENAQLPKEPNATREDPIASNHPSDANQETESPQVDKRKHACVVEHLLSSTGNFHNPRNSHRDVDQSTADSVAPQTGRSLLSLIFREPQGGTPPEVFDALYMNTPTSPKSFFIHLCSKVGREGRDAYNIPSGINVDNFTVREKKYITNHPSDFDLYVEENSGYIFPTSCRSQRSAMRWVLEELRGAGERTISLDTMKHTRPDLWGDAADFIEHLADLGDICYDEDESTMKQLYRVPDIFPWETAGRCVGFQNVHNSEGDSGTQTIRFPYAQRAQTQVIRPNAQKAPNLDGVEVGEPAIASILLNPLDPPTAIPSLVDPILDFRRAHIDKNKETQVLEYIRSQPESSPNCSKLTASILRLYYSSGDPDDTPIIYVPVRGWFVYDTHWVEQGEEKIQLYQLLQTDFLDVVTRVKNIASRMNLFKPLRCGKVHPRRKYLVELESSLSNSRSLSDIAYESRPYFLRRGPMDEDPMLLQLKNGTLDLRTNSIRQSCPKDYLTKCSNVYVPDYAKDGRNSSEPESASTYRKMAYDFLWSIFRPGPDGKPHPYDHSSVLGNQDEENFRFFLLLLARLLEGRPLKRAVFFFSPRGRNSKRPIEIILSQILGTYYSQCRNSVFTNDRRGDEANSAVSLSRRDVRVLMGQEIDRSIPWCNATFKRRADCGREGGTKKNSNAYEEYNPVYTVAFGANVPPSFSRAPQNSEIDRCLVVYLPNRFCDEVDMEKEPLSPRRFPKLDVEPMVAKQEVSWAILDILLRLRRANPNVGDIIDRGTATSRMWKDIWFPDAGSMYMRERLDKNKKSYVRVQECVGGFREWACSRLRSAYDYAKASDSCVRDLLQGILGQSATLKKVLVFHGYEFKQSTEVQNQNKRHPAVGMEKREIRKNLPRDDASLAHGQSQRNSVLGKSNTPRSPRYTAAAGSRGVISAPPRRLILARGGPARCIRERSPPPTYRIEMRQQSITGDLEGGPELVTTPPRRLVLVGGGGGAARSIRERSPPPRHRIAIRWGFNKSELGDVPVYDALSSESEPTVSGDVGHDDGVMRACWCSSADLRPFLRGRCHYHCPFLGCNFTADTEVKTRRHELRHDREAGRTACYCDCRNVGDLGGTRHYHCRSCARAFDRIDRVTQHEGKHTSTICVGEDPVPHVGMPGVGDAVQNFATRLVKKDITPDKYTDAVSDLLKDSLRIGRPPDHRPNLLSDPDFREAFLVDDISTDTNARPRMVLVYDDPPRVWIARCSDTSDIREFALKSSVCWCHRVGFFTLRFCLRVWSFFIDTLNLDATRRSILHDWTARVSWALSRKTGKDPKQYDWILGAVPSSHVLRQILLKSRSLLDRWAHNLAASLAILDGHVVRMDGHFKLPKKIKIGEKKNDHRCMLAFIGCNGFLLKEVSLVQSESGDAYLSELIDVLVLRQQNGLPPPHLITDNPCLIDRKIGALLQVVWGNQRDYYLAGDPVHRKIEFQESLDHTHQDSIDAISDFAYVIRRFSHLITPDGESGIPGAISKLVLHIATLTRRVDSGRRDPFGVEMLGRTQNGNICRKRENYVAMFRRNDFSDRTCGVFDSKEDGIIHSFAQSGHLKKQLPPRLRSKLVDYRDKPVMYRSFFAPCGLVRRILLADDEKRHGKTHRCVRHPETDYFPAYGNYEELVQEICRFVFWYGEIRRSRPIRRAHLPREDGDQNGANPYPLRTTPVLSTKAIDVLRRMLLVQNARHYMSHILIANDVYNKQDSAYKVFPDHPGQSTEGSDSDAAESPRLTDPVLKHPVPSPRCYAGGRYFAPGPERSGFSTGSASVEAFFQEI